MKGIPLDPLWLWISQGVGGGAYVSKSSLCLPVSVGSARDLISTHFADGISELAIAYILLGILRALEYIHHMGYVHR